MARPSDHHRDKNPTVPLVRVLQEGATEEGWGELSEKVERILRRAFGTDDLPVGTEFADFQQLVFVRLLTAIPSLDLRTRQEFWGFVKTVADHTKLDLWRRARTEKNNRGRAPDQQCSSQGEDQLAAPDRADHPPSAFARGVELEERELECVQKLPNEEAREVYLLRRRAGKTYEAIARAVGRKQSGTVKVIFHRAQKSVANCLRARLDGYTVFFDKLD